MGSSRDVRWIVRNSLAAMTLTICAASLPSCLFLEAVLPGDQSSWFADVDGGANGGDDDANSMSALDGQRLMSVLEQAGVSGGSLQLDVSDWVHHLFLLDRLECAGVTPDSAPQLYRSISMARYAAIRDAADDGSNGPPITAQFSIFQFAEDDPQRLTAVVDVSAPFAETLTVIVDLFDADRMTLLASQSQQVYHLGSGRFGLLRVSVGADNATSQRFLATVTCVAGWRGELMQCYVYTKYLAR